MFARALRHARTRRRGLATAVALALVAAPLVFFPSPASATIADSPFNGLGGEIDALAGALNPDTPSGSLDNSYVGGTKEDTSCPGVTTGSIPPNKDDLLGFYVATGKGQTSGDTYLYLAWTRTNALGTATMDFELNKSSDVVHCNGVNALRTEGDLLFTYDFQGGQLDAIEYRTWDGTSWGSAEDILLEGVSEGSIAADMLSGEMVIDLEAAHIFDRNECQNFAGASVKSRASSSSFENQLKDFIGFVPKPVSNCGTLEVVKNLLPSGDPGKFNLLIDSVVKATDVGDDGSTGAITVQNGSHSFGESAGTGTDLANYAPTKACQDGSGPVTITGSSVNVTSNQHVVCTITNTRKTGTLKVIKNLLPTNDPGKFNLSIDSSVKVSNVGNGGTTGTVTVETGSHTFGESAGTSTSLADYTTTKACVDDSGPVTFTEWSVNVAYNQHVVCTITNTRKTGTLTVVKDLSPSTDLGLFNLSIDGSVKVSNVGDNGTTGAVTVNTGSHTFGETAGTATNLADYVETSSCSVNGNTVSSTGNSVNVGDGQNVICTIRNTRRTGTLTVKKVLVPSNDPGKFNLLIDGGIEAANIGDGGTTGAIGLNTGTHSFAETAGTGTSLSDYISTSDCRAGVTPVTITSGSISLGEQNIVCTITNTRKTGTLEVVKDLSPSNDPGLFNLSIDGSVKVSNVGDGGTTGVVAVNTGSHTFGESAGTSTVLADYTTAKACRDDSGPVTINDWSVNVAYNQHVVCTITNTRKTGTLTVVKDLSPSNDPGLFNLSIDGSVKVTDIGDGGTTGAVTLNTGSHTFGESAGTGTSLDDYTSAAACNDDEGAVASSGGSVNITYNQHVVCTITNTRKTGTLTVTKDLTRPGDPGLFNLLIDGAVKAADVGDNGSTGQVTLNTGSHTFAEAAGTGTSLADYQSSSSCVAGGESVPIDDGSVMIGEDEDVVCTITNVRITGSLTVTKTTNGGTGTFEFDVVCGDGQTQVVTIVGSGSETVFDIPTGTNCTVTERNNPLFSSTVLPQDGTVVIDRDGETVAFVNTAKPNGLTLDKKVNGGDHATTDDALLAHSGDQVTYTVVVTNTGSVPLTITALTDSLYPALITACPQAVGSLLASGASFTCTYTVAASADAHNVAAISAVDGLDRGLSASDGTYVDVINPAISIVKTANPESVSVSGPVTYTYVVTNTGDTMLHDVTVTDDILGAIGTVGQLAGGESVTMAKTVQVDASTPPRNIGTAVGTDVLGQTVLATDDAVIAVVLAAVAELPRTGSPVQSQTRAAILLIEVGVFMILAGRRRRGGRRAD